MTKHLSALKTITALTLFGSTSFACADVVRCEGEAGNVAYTDTACGSNMQATQFILLEKPPIRNVIYQQSSKIAQMRASTWADTSIVPRTRKVDTESVRSARLKMISADNAPRHLAAPK